jgi:hypothetical protein
VVIGNPPYIDSEHMVILNLQTREQYVSLYESAKGNWDLFVIFVEKGIKLVRRNGIITYIIPNKIISQNYAMTIREIILKISLCEIRDYSRQNVFPIADVYPITILLRNIKSHEKEDVKLFSMKTMSEIVRGNIINKHLLSKYPWDIFFCEPEITSILIKIANNQMNFKDFVNFESPCTVGEAYKIKDDLEDSQSKKGKRLINSGTIDKYISLWGYKITRYIKSQYQYPVISNTNLANISKKRFFQTESKKVIIANMTRELEAFLDLKGEYLAGKSTVIGLGSNTNLKLFLALLNSKLISVWYKSANHSTEMAGEALSITDARLGNIPIPDISTNCVVKKIEKIIDKILAIKAEDMRASISSFERQIDNLVYRLYDLTYDEVKVIEPDFPLGKAEYGGIEVEGNNT